MQKDKLNYLLDKYLKQELSHEEQDELNDWYHKLNYGRKNFDLWVTEAGGKEKLTAQFLEDFQERLNRKKIKPLYYIQRIAAAAVVLIFIAAALLLFNRKTPVSKHTANNLSSVIIKPGQNKATLTLSNGKKIILGTAANGQLVQQAGIKITKTTNGQLIYQNTATVSNTVHTNTLSTVSGEQYQIVLSDGTHVWLNAASSLTYPERFTGAERKVQLTGEAYFEVAHNKAAPFIVLSDQQSVEVLGTHFNINAYQDEGAVKTTLLQGSVRVRSLNSDAARILKPGEQSLLNEHTLIVQKADIDEAIEWKNGYFVFNDEDIHSIMKQIARWYNVEVEYNDSFKNKKFGASISRSKNINELLDAMELTNGIHFKIEGRRIKVMK